jgi:hypothetical protein
MRQRMIKKGTCNKGRAYIFRPKIRATYLPLARRGFDGHVLSQHVISTDVLIRRWCLLYQGFSFTGAVWVAPG